MAFADNITSDFELLEKNLNGQKEGFLHKLRKEALSSFQKLGIPGNRNEEWKYTHIKTKLPETLSIGSATRTTGSAMERAAVIVSEAELETSKLVFVNGVYNKNLSTIIEQSGVTVGNLKEHFTASKALVEKHYDK